MAACVIALSGVLTAQPRAADLVIAPAAGQPPQMQLSFALIVPGWSYAVRVSTDFKVWTALTGAAQSDAKGGRTVTDAAAGGPYRFCRVAGPSLDLYRNPNPLRIFYINATTGNDLADGASPNTAWRSLDKAHPKGLKAGDVVRLARGSVWAGENFYFGNGLVGTAEAPIVIEAYGEGEPPTIRDPRAPWEDTVTKIHPPFDAVYLDGASAYVNVLDLRIQDSDPQVAGVSTGWSSHHLVIAGVEVANVGRGMMNRGSHQRVIACTIRDLVAPTAAAGEVVADPKVGDAAGDYRLAAGSPAINAGVAASDSYDLRGTFVPTGTAPDLGAYEAN